MAIVGIILAVLVGIGFIFALPQFFGQTGVYVGQAFVEFVSKAMTIVALSIPILTVLAFFYISLQKEKTEVMVFGAVYGVLVYLLLMYTGLYDVIASRFYASYCLYHASIIDALYGVKEALIGFAMFIVGTVTRALDNAVSKIFGDKFSSWVRKKRRR